MSDIAKELSSFSGAEFDPKAWINSAWSAAPEPRDKELFVSGTVAKLQLYVQQLTNALDETTTQIVTSMPRVLQEATLLQQDGALLRERLLALERQVAAVEAETGHSIESLQRIDKLKSKLENAASALREADKWAQLAGQLEAVLEAGVPARGEKLQELTQQVAAMTASLEVLSNDADYEAKRVQLEVLYNRLEAALSPAVVDALQQKNVESARAYTAIFTAMGRSDAAVRYWRRVEAARLEATWRRRQDADAAHAPLRDLHADLVSHAHSQMEWLSDVLKSSTPLTELVRLYTELLTGLEPAPTHVTSAALKRCAAAADAINMMLDVREALKAFVSSLSTLIGGAEGEDVLPAAVKELGRAAHAPLRDLLPRYTELQAQALTDRLRTLSCDQEDALERARAIQSSVERSGSWVKSAHASGRKLAGNACYSYLLPALEAFIAAHCSRLSSNLRLLESEFLQCVAAGASGSLLSRLFPAALALMSAAGDLLVMTRGTAESVRSEIMKQDPEDSSPLESLEALLLDSEGAAALARLRRAAQGEGVLAAALDDVGRVCRGLKSVALKIVFEPVAMQLERIPELVVWKESDPLAADLPDFSLAPQEYITQIGQYLMTLPQHLEPLLSERGAGLLAAHSDSDPAVYFLNEVCSQTCEMYADKVLSVRNMDALGAKRCATDIAYLCSVVEDLGGNVLPALRTLEKSLRTATPSSAE